MQPTLRTRVALTGLTLALLPSLGFANPALPANPPLPSQRPYQAVGNVDNSFTTNSIVAQSAAAMATDLIVTGDVSRLKAGLDALQSGNISRARTARNNLPSNSLDRAILSWAIATSGAEGVPSSEIAEAAFALKGWPGMSRLRANSERALLRENAGPQAVLRAFGDTQPETREGTIALTRAHLSVGNTQAARATLAPFWRTERLEPGEEASMIREFGRLLPASDHWARMESMLHIDRVTSAERVAGLAGGEALTKAWAAVIRGENNAGRLLAAVPQAQKKAGFYFAQARHQRRAERYKEAAQTILQAPTGAANLVNPDAWWIERRVLARELIDLGENRLAYQVAAGHSAESPANAVDAEFHAGWFALRFLNDPRTAHNHFNRIVQISEGPISLSRGYYWLGRAAEAGGPGTARDYYQRGARYGTAFYGQLAAAKLNATTISAAFPSASDADRRNFEGRQAVQAIRRLERAGHQGRANTLYRDLALQLDSVGELALLAVMAERRGDHPLALRVGKWAAGRGLDVGALAHPVGAIPGNANISAAGKALAYAIARQESEFNISARSGAGALGILQLLPGTARDMARKTGVSFDQARLTRDAGYNAALGAAYLGEQLDRFNGSYILTFAGYNAGPSRAAQWVSRFGDPRGQNIEQVVDWIERIPFHETRSYVQRVMENYQVYKMRLSGRADVVADLTGGRR
ncbi:transglycosylase SLT domain-containing protein [Aliihoeflea aestuarii]|jgi:soluble lytic murein transglycosylase|uniref:lytic transglycosylase domain-containing protein n=1 Tax=Aliihoeflea aestuarii TaxID=453840 RepID=UPI002093FD6C|nr:lytic transglycosylase domain-containing protein [Aliihoeflea aestuarii]MCO6389431.1 transglycosylase SLT domain-containing protein [Aliihoeflea aestuarii]